MKRGTFKKKTLEQVKEKQNLKINKVLGIGLGSWGNIMEGKQSSLYKTYKRAVTPKIKRTRIKKQKLKSISQLKKTLWKTIGIKVRLRDKNKCFTSGKEVFGSNCHVGHGIPSSVGGALCRYHPYNLHVQSYVENIHFSGNGGEYYRRQIIKYGQDKIDRLYELKNHSIQADRYFYTTMNELWEIGNETEIIKFLESYL
jgi:hypothetical protein